MSELDELVVHGYLSIRSESPKMRSERSSALLDFLALLLSVLQEYLSELVLKRELLSLYESVSIFTYCLLLQLASELVTLFLSKGRVDLELDL